MIKTKRTFAGMLLAAVTCVALAFGIAFTDSGVTAKADEEPTITGADFDVAMAVRSIDPEKYPNGGVRFRTRVEKTKFDALLDGENFIDGVKTGILVTSKAIADELEGGLVLANNKVDGVYDLDTTKYWYAATENATDYYESVGVIYNVPFAKTTVKLAVRPYVTIGGTTIYRDEAGVASMADVVKALDNRDGFESYLPSYTITWKNGEDTLETDENVEYGDTPEYNGATPTKEATAQYTYTFDTWTPAVTAVTGDATYIATYIETVNNYTVKFDTNGGTSIADGEVSYGDTAVQPTDPVKAGNTFNGWKLGAEDYNFTAPVTEDITLTADYTPYYFDADFSSATHVEPAEGLKIKVDGLGGAVPDPETALYDDNGTSVIKVVTAVDLDASGVKVTLGDGLAVADYACIKFRVKTTNGVSVDVNDKNCTFASYANYTDVDLISLAKDKGMDTVYSFSVYRTLLDDITICVDKVIIVGWGSDINYDFSSESDADIYAVSATGGATLNGIVSDANATDGYAVKATTVAASASGLVINFNNVTLADWDGIVLRFRTTNSVGVQVYSEKNGAWINAANWGNYPSYTKVNLKGVLEANGDTTLTQFRITRDSVNGIEIYVDYVMFYDEMPSPYNMTSLSDDKPSVSGGTTSIVADAGVDDGYALQISVSGGSWKHCYLTLSTPFTYNDYAAIKIRLKKTGGYVYACNGSNTTIASSYSIPDATYNDFVDFYIFPTADVAKIDFSTGGVSSITVVIDDITLIPVSQLDSFYTYSEDTVKTSTNATIVADKDATDGYALKIVKNNGNNAYYYLGRSFTLADYEHIYVRCRCDSGIGVYARNATTPNKGTGDAVTISTSMTTTYTTIDLVTILTTIDTFNQIDIWCTGSEAVYIDSITFVKKAA